MCVCERERERVCVCVCVFVCERERKRERVCVCLIEIESVIETTQQFIAIGPKFMVLRLLSRCIPGVNVKDFRKTIFS